MQLVAVDTLGPFLESEAGNIYMLVAADIFTRWMEVHPTRRPLQYHSLKASDEVYSHFSPPEQLHPSQGRLSVVSLYKVVPSRYALLQGHFSTPQA